MIIYRALIREVGRNTAAITLILLVVMGFIALTGFLGRATGGDMAEDIVMPMLGLEMLKHLDLLLTLGLYLGTLLTVARWYRDSEMTVLAACGMGLLQFLRPTLTLTAFLSVAVAVLSFYFTPWAADRMDRLRTERQHQTQVSDIAPGMFNEVSGDSARIFYAERVNRETWNMEHVFLSGLEDTKNGQQSKDSVAIAHTAHPRTDERTGDHFIVLVDGTAYEGNPGDPAYKIVRFETLDVRIDQQPYKGDPPTMEATGSGDLLSQYKTSGPARAEWHWRLSKPLTIVVLVLFAMVLAHTDPRRGRLSNMFAAILVYFTYSNVLALGQTLLKKGRVPGFVGLWCAHAILLVIVVYLLNRRAANRPLLAWPKQGR